MKALKSLLCTNFKEYVILAKAFSFLLASQKRDLTCGSNVILLSIWILRSFSNLLLEMAIPPRRCDFSGFAFRRLSVNHLKKILDIFSRSRNSLFKLTLVEWGVLTSAWLVISRSRKNLNKLYRNMLNNYGPSMDAWLTLKIISGHEMCVSFNSTFCFCLIKCECNDIYPISMKFSDQQFMR